MSRLEKICLCVVTLLLAVIIIVSIVTNRFELEVMIEPFLGIALHDPMLEAYQSIAIGTERDNDVYARHFNKYFQEYWNNHARSNQEYVGVLARIKSETRPEKYYELKDMRFNFDPEKLILGNTTSEFWRLLVINDKETKKIIAVIYLRQYFKKESPDAQLQQEHWLKIDPTNTDFSLRELTTKLFSEIY